ncbi:MAG: type II toxin-antitoxin system VapC family toxin [Terriglobales bacterium]
MFLLDTNVISELRKIGVGRADANVTRWQSAANTATLYVSVVTLMELEIGTLLLARRDARQAAMLREWLEGYVLPEFENRTLAIDRAVALRCARLHVPNRRPERDAYIAASALVHGMAVVTRNTGDYADLGVEVVNPWSAGA